MHIARDAFRLASFAVRSRSRSAAENLFLREQLALQLLGKMPYNGGHVATKTLEALCPKLPLLSPPLHNSRAC
jgi:hypothetical protein